VRVKIGLSNDGTASFVRIQLRLDEAEMLLEELSEIEPSDLGAIEREMSMRLEEKLGSLRAFLGGNYR
jgi:hypothetical protein